MNLKTLKSFLFTAVVFISATLVGQDNPEKLKAHYNGFKNDAYTFSYIETATGKKEIISFQYVKPELIETFNLKKEFFEGVYFEVTYFISDINGKYTYRITDLKEIKEPKTKENNSIAKMAVKEKLEAYYMGMKNNMYSFSFTEEATGEKETIYFHKVAEKVSETYNLKQEYFEGVLFEIVYVTKTENGSTTYEIIELKEIEDTEEDD